MTRETGPLPVRLMRPGTRFPGRLLVTCLVGLAGLGTAPTPAVAAGPAEPLGHAGRWITDAEGRVVVLHGFNTVPWNETVQPKDMGMGPDNAEWLAENGFNTIRLGLYYARVEPQMGVYDDAYLEDYLRVQKELADQGIFSLLVMHQDQLNPRFGDGNPGLPSRGFPDWFIRDDGFPNTRTDYPQGYLTNPALNRAYDNIWQDFDPGDGQTAQEHFAEGWQRVARAFEGRPGLLGYDIFNEPWPGSAAASCASPAGCPPGGFDQTLLTDFNRRITAALRAEDPEHLIFYEPNLQFNFGAQTQVGDPGDENAGFSFHNYCLSMLQPGEPTYDQCEVGEALNLDNALAHSEQTGSALLLTEFMSFRPPLVRRMMRLTDERMLSWQSWDYYGDFSPIPEQEEPYRYMIRPYPQLVSGTPLNWSFDEEGKVFDFSYEPTRVDGEGAVLDAPARFPAGSITEVFVPEQDYPDGYGVAVAGAEVISQPGDRLLRLRSCSGATRIQLQVAPGEPGPTSCKSAGQPAGCAFSVEGTKRADGLAGGPFADRLRGRAGPDRLRGRGGDDCINSGDGADRAWGGPGGDAVRGGAGADALRGGPNSDRITAGAGADRIKARDGDRDVVRCGRGKDRARLDEQDRSRGCERG